LRQPKVEIERFHPSQKDTPILIGHGKDDDKVPVKASENAYRLLKKQKANVELLLYNGKHKIGMEYMKKVREIIQL
jgi:predicted esterase